MFQKNTILVLLLSFCTFIIISIASLAQTPAKQVHEQGQAWLGYINQTRISDKFSLWLDLHARRTDLFDRWATTIIRPGITYHFPHNINFTAGYAYVSHYPAAGLNTVRPEHRPWQQVSWTRRAKHIQMQQWVRFEQRFNRKIANDELQEGYNFNYRFRYLLSVLLPIKKEFIEPNSVFFVFNDEIHINAGKQITYNYFDQNRFFLGFGYQFTKSLNAQLGYMNLFQQLPAGNRYNNNHTIRLFIFNNIDLRKKNS
ncbi:DUF2490 domain-containing protein [Rhodocytophaga rosea]|uniref:DUF2490 domain-containing protein n=1 Tax=Rhodocytophaga rosea TaxID=2704465 RepID=A0A6C0GM82_9BACT|nr:DUF2490 domain-containing protein [Rhodocytophaga rosea]